MKLTRLILHELNRPRLAETVTRLCGWRKTPTDLLLPGVWQLGTWNDLRANLYWCAGGRADRVRRMVDSLFAIDSSPFILVLPTRANLTPSLDAALKREGCCALPLDEHLSIEAAGKLKLVQSIDGIREEFEERAATRRDTGKVLQGIEKNIAIISRQKTEVPKEATAASPPKYLVRLDGTRRRAGKQDRTAVSIWRIGFNGQEILLPPWVAADFLVYLLRRQGKEFDASALIEAVRKSHAGTDSDTNAILYGDDIAACHNRIGCGHRQPVPVAGGDVLGGCQFGRDVQLAQIIGSPARHRGVNLADVQQKAANENCEKMTRAITPQTLDCFGFHEPIDEFL